MRTLTGNNMATLIPSWAIAAPTYAYDATPTHCFLCTYNALYDYDDTRRANSRTSSTTVTTTFNRDPGFVDNCEFFDDPADGYEQDTADHGMSLYGYRYYKPDIGRWVNRDPIGEEAFRLFNYGIDMFIKYSAHLRVDSWADVTAYIRRVFGGAWQDFFSDIHRQRRETLAALTSGDIGSIIHDDVFSALVDCPQPEYAAMVAKHLIGGLFFEDEIRLLVDFIKYSSIRPAETETYTFVVNNPIGFIDVLGLQDLIVPNPGPMPESTSGCQTTRGVSGGGICVAQCANLDCEKNVGSAWYKCTLSNHKCVCRMYHAGNPF